MLRDYAHAHRLCIDSFVAGFPQTRHANACFGLTPFKMAIYPKRADQIHRRRVALTDRAFKSASVPRLFAE